MSSASKFADAFLSVMSVSYGHNTIFAFLTPFGEPKERFADLDMGSMSSGSSRSLVTVSEILMTWRLGVVMLSLLGPNCFRGVVGALVKDMPDPGS